MTTYRADCHTPDNADTDRRIQGLGGTYPEVWWYGIDTIIRKIDSGDDIFFTMVNGEVALIVVDEHPVTKRRFLKTKADSYLFNNLLYLPHG